MNTNSSQTLTHFEEVVAEIDIIATTVFKPDHFIQSLQLNFIPSFDDLDFLSFASITLPSGHKIALVRHQNAPYPNTEIRISPASSSPSSILAEALNFLNLSSHDLNWIHPHLHLSA